MVGALYGVIKSDRYVEATYPAYVHIETRLVLGDQELHVSLHEDGQWHLTIKQHYQDSDPSVSIQGSFDQGITTTEERKHK